MVKRKCKLCGKIFFTWPCRIKVGWGNFCSHKCVDKFRSLTYVGKNSPNYGKSWSASIIKKMSLGRKGKCLGSDNPSWRGGPVKRKCVICGKIFYVRRDAVKKGFGNFCSRRCTYVHIQRSLSGKNSPHWCRIKCKCKTCGKILYIIPSRIKRSRKVYCNLKCRGRDKSLYRFGKKNSNWRGGPVKRKCVICGKIFYARRWVLEHRPNGGKSCSQSCGRVNVIFPLKDSWPERLLQQVLEKNQVRFEKHKKILGQPDIFIKPNICIFADGDYFHANPQKYKAYDRILGGVYAKDKWARDKRITKNLQKMGYKVLRFWEYDIKNNLQECFYKIVRGMS